VLVAFRRSAWLADPPTEEHAAATARRVRAHHIQVDHLGVHFSRFHHAPQLMLASAASITGW
jgi:hypothetical protein